MSDDIELSDEQREMVNNPQPRSKVKGYQLRLTQAAQREAMARERKRYAADAETQRAQPVAEAEKPAAEVPKSKAALQRAHRKTADTMTILQGITAAFTPEEVAKMLHQARDYAVQWKSWEGLLAIVKFQAEYTVGKPVQRSVSTNITPEQFAAFLQDE